jgi:micrococcal nuclease
LRNTTVAPATLALLITLLSAHATAEVIIGTVTHVDSGDTLVVDDGSHATQIRLADIGAPQGSEYFSPGARTLLESMVTRGPVRVTVTGREGTERAFGRVFAGELDVNRELVRRGAAWVCWDYAAGTELLPYENEAKRYRRGLWSHVWEIDAFADCRRRPPAVLSGPGSSGNDRKQ